MYTLNVRNVNHALPLGLSLLRDEGMRIAPRGASTLELEGPVATIYHRPREMVLFDQARDANPFFHFFEALWILAGRNDVAFLAHFNKKMAEFSDDGKTFHAPYGHRLRKPQGGINEKGVPMVGQDQIERAIEKLRTDPDSRQVVMTIWDTHQDWQRTKDVPCNWGIMFKIRDGALRMTICNRSNDIVWGAYGANVVQFSTLLVYMAGRIGCGIGTYTQLSDSYHVYEDNPYWVGWLPTHTAGVPPILDPYVSDEELIGVPSKWMLPFELQNGHFDRDLKMMFSVWDEDFDPSTAGYLTASFNCVANPMWNAHRVWKSGRKAEAISLCAAIEAPDWRKACREWMLRRLNK